jgi:hypothetical protein
VILEPAKWLKGLGVKQESFWAAWCAGRGRGALAPALGRP